MVIFHSFLYVYQRVSPMKWGTVVSHVECCWKQAPSSGWSPPVALDPKVLIKAKTLNDRYQLIQHLAKSCNDAMEELMAEDLKPLGSCQKSRVVTAWIARSIFIDLLQSSQFLMAPIGSVTFETHLATLQASLYPSVYMYHAGMKKLYAGASEAESGFKDGRFWGYDLEWLYCIN